MGKIERNGKAGGVSEQRFVVEITRPVPAEKVGKVAERIAARLRLDLERIHTLLDGRVGPVTRPVLADKADSIAEVFAEAGVRVIVVGAPISAGAGPAVPAATAFETTTADVTPSGTSAPVAPAADVPASEVPASEVAVTAEAASEPASEPSNVADSWDASTAWSYGASDIDQWQAAQEEVAAGRVFGPAEIDGSSSSTVQDRDDIDQSSQASVTAETLPDTQAYEPAAAPPADAVDHQEYSVDQPTAAPPDRFDEDEADRLGPASSRAMPEQLFTTSTRWVPSPHDAYGFDLDEEPYVPAEEGDGQTVVEVQEDYFEPRGYEVPEWRGGYPRPAPALRTYLLWSLAASLLVLILLQVVFAARGLAGDNHLDYDVGLRAYQQGDFASAKRIWGSLADEGEPRAQYQLGFMAQHGLGQPWSNARAANYYRRAAEAGLAEAQLALGELYFRGLGVEMDARVGAQWYQRAAESGYPEAQYEYGQLLMHGDGVSQRFDEALAWFEVAATGGVARAADLVAFVKSASLPRTH